MPKPRSDSLYAQLTPDQREQAATWLIDESMAYDKALAAIENTFGVETSETAVRNLRRQLAQERNLDRISAGAKAANEVLAVASKNPSDTFGAFEAMLGAMVMDATMENKDASQLKELATLYLSAASHRLKQNELDLAVKKWTDAKRSNIDKALDALMEEAIGNPIALDHLNKARQAVQEALAK